MAYNRLSTYRTAFAVDGDCGQVIYASTCIVQWNADEIVLNTGGWKTVTTKRKMNQAARQFDLGYGVHQRKGVWYVSFWNEGEARWEGEIEFEGSSIAFDREFGIVVARAA